jgi:hypothetical protein
MVGARPRWSPEAMDDERGRHDATARHLSRVERVRPRRRRWVLAGLGGLAAVLAVWAGWLGVDAQRARAELLEAAQLVVAMQDQVMAGDRDAAAQTLVQVQEHAAAALEATHGPHWSAAAALPWVGPDIRAVQTASEVVDSLAVDVLPSLVDVAATVEPSALAPVDGRVNLAPLQDAAPVVVAAAEQVETARSRLAGLAPESLWPVVADPLAELQRKVDDVAMLTATASRSVQLLPPMLGADGPRTYLVLVQNPAEPRATGGVPSLVVLRANDGAVEVVEQRSAVLGNLTDAVLPLTREEDLLFSDLVGSFMGDVTFTPDFPRSGELAQAIWEQQVGTDLDGVLSIEPGAIGMILGVTGPVTLSNGVQLTDANAAQWLMNTVYLDYPTNEEQDRLFTEATSVTFGALASGGWDASAMINVLAEAARQGRLMVWSSHEEEQALIAGTVLSGELTGVRGNSPEIGLFFNDGTQSKIGYYLRADVSATTTRCLEDGSQQITVGVALTSTAPLSAAELPPYISGGQVLPAGQIRANVLLYAPEGGWVDTVRVVGAEPGVHSQFHDGLAVAGKTIVLAPGARVFIEYDVRSGPDEPGTPVLRVTPLAQRTVAYGGTVTCG